jgi:PilZ domain
MCAFSGTPSNPTGGSGPYPNKREVPRFSLIATVVLREPDSDTKISGRISELSRKGCYVDTLITLPEGTLLEVRISRDQGVFQSKGKIVYVQTGMGMGVAFLEVDAGQLEILDTWLAALSP